MNQIWLEAVLVGAEVEKMCVLVGGFSLNHPHRGMWAVNVCDGVAGRDFDFGVNEAAARDLYGTLLDKVAAGEGGLVLFDERTMETKEAP